MKLLTVSVKSEECFRRPRQGTPTRSVWHPLRPWSYERKVRSGFYVWLSFGTPCNWEGGDFPTTRKVCSLYQNRSLLTIQPTLRSVRTEDQQMYCVILTLYSLVMGRSKLSTFTIFGVNLRGSPSTYKRRVRISNKNDSWLYFGYLKWEERIPLWTIIPFNDLGIIHRREEEREGPRRQDGKIGTGLTHKWDPISTVRDERDFTFTNPIKSQMK